MRKRVLLIGGINAVPLGQGVVKLMMKEYDLRLFISSANRRITYEDGIERFYGELHRFGDVYNAARDCDVVVISYRTTLEEGIPAIEMENIDRIIQQVGVERVVYIKEHRNQKRVQKQIADYCSVFSMWG